MTECKRKKERRAGQFILQEESHTGLVNVISFSFPFAVGKDYLV